MIANEVRCVPAFPPGVEVHSLGKERGAGRSDRGWRFERTLGSVLRRRTPAGLFAHMCPDYLSLAAPLAKARRVRTMLWFAHPANSWRLALAERLADRIVTSLPGSYPRASSKVRAIGQAIDVDRFTLRPPPARGDGSLRLVSVGRMSDSKRYDLALEAVAAASTRGTEVTLTIAGPATTDRERANERALRGAIDARGLSEVVRLEPAMEPSRVPAMLAEADGLLNTTVDGSGDKVVFESMATGRPVIVANRSMAELVTVRPDLAPASGAEGLADRIAALAAMSSDDRAAAGRELRGRVVAGHSIAGWAGAIAAICREPR